MPDTKTTGRKRPAKAASPQAPAPLPNRQDMDRFVAEAGSRRQPLTDRAQQMAYDAMEKRTARGRISAARKALTVSPLCGDAYFILAQEEARSPDQKRDYLERAMEAAALALGPDAFEALAGQFWGWLETRPYMRARSALAHFLMHAGDLDGAIGHFRAMLELNPNDNQGVRDSLLTCLLRREDIAGIQQLLDQYPDEWGVFWLYTKALLAFRERGGEDAGAIAVAREAVSANAHVPGTLSGEETGGDARADLIALGGPDEAAYYVADCGEAWRRTSGAVAWLAGVAAAPARKPRKRGR